MRALIASGLYRNPDTILGVISMLVKEKVNNSFLFLTDPEGLARKRSKFEALRLDCVLQPNNLPQPVVLDSCKCID